MFGKEKDRNPSRLHFFSVWLTRRFDLLYSGFSKMFAHRLCCVFCIWTGNIYNAAPTLVQTGFMDPDEKWLRSALSELEIAHRGKKKCQNFTNVLKRLQNMDDLVNVKKQMIDLSIFPFPNVVLFPRVVLPFKCISSSFVTKPWFPDRYHGTDKRAWATGGG